MNRLKKIICVLLLPVAMSSCDKNFEEINTDYNNTPYAEASQLLAPALVNISAAHMSRNRTFNNELMQVTVDVSDAEGKVFRYDFRNNWSDYMYNTLYSELTNIIDIYEKAKNSDVPNTSYQGISLILQAFVFANLTDIYGDIPYFEAIKAREFMVLEPKFDRQIDIYTDIFKKLEEANTLLSKNSSIVATSDPIYKGNVSRWRRFGNSLYLRYLLRVAHKSEVKQYCEAKIKEVVESSSYPVFSSNDDSAMLRWTGVPPYNSPFMNILDITFRDPGICSFFIDKLSSWGDPRLDVALWGRNGVNRLGIAAFNGMFVGVPSGYSAGEFASKKSYFYASNQTYSGNPVVSLMSDDKTAQWMTFAELEFIKAEAAVKGFLTSSAETHYNSGVLNAIKLWVPEYNVPIQEYLQEADLLWDNQETDQDQLMEAIHVQKYYALFLCGFEQWFEYRRTGHPVLPKGAGLRNNGEMPSRMVYPVYLQSTNPTNYKLAVERQGADVISTKVWWQK